MGNGDGRGPVRLLASWRALAVIAVVITGLVVLGTGELRQQIENRAVGSAIVGARSVSLLIVNRNVTVDDVKAGVVVGSRNNMEGDLLLLLRQRELIGLVARIRTGTEEAGLPVTAIKVEVSETSLTGSGADQVVKGLRELCEAGIRVSLDDVGQGQRPLLGLAGLPLDRLKIHPDFVAGPVTDQRLTIMTTHILGLARYLGARCVAAGVATLPMWHRLIDLGCDEIQGDALTPPLPAEHVIAGLDRPREDGSVRR